MSQSIPSITHYTAPDYLPADASNLDVAQIRRLRSDRRQWLRSPRVQTYAKAVRSTSAIRSSHFSIEDGTVAIGRPEELSPDQVDALRQSLNAFCPWKKGPFRIFGTLIDAEWRSDWKWHRILPHIQPLRDRRIADIGCHNGYFMFRMVDHNPLQVIGFEPVAKHWWNFQLLQNIVRSPNLHFELLGVEHMGLYPGYFDTIFCLGILYHHADPIGLLRKMRMALAPKGEIIIDCQGIPGGDPVALVPRGRYAKARGIWFLPTQLCLEHWISRAGFTQISCFFAEPLSVHEQRSTAWATIDSLADFLDPTDPTRTVEGYPAPWRYYIRARRG